MARVCSNPKCHMVGQPQPDNNFYGAEKRKYRCKKCLNEAGKRNHARLRLKKRTSEWDGDRETQMRLPGHPWREWLINEIAHENWITIGLGEWSEIKSLYSVIMRARTGVTSPDPSAAYGHLVVKLYTANVAERLGIPPRIISRWLRESNKVQLDAVDRALCNFGAPWVLRDLWPDELYSFDDDAQVAA